MSPNNLSPAVPPSNEYHHILRSQPNRLLRSSGAILTTASAITASILSTIPFSNLLDLAILGNAPLRDRPLQGLGPSSWTPGLMLGSNLLTSSPIAVALLVERYVYKQELGSVCSVENRFRWRLLLNLAKSIIPTTLFIGGLMQAVDPVGWPQLTARTVTMGLTVLATTPLQAAGEEFLVRGLLSRIVGSWFRDIETSFWASAGVTSIFFASLHGSRNIGANGYYLLSGLCGSLMTRWTGGLEASSLVHAMNNLVLMLPPVLAGNLGYIEDIVTMGPSPTTLAFGTANLLAVTYMARGSTSQRKKVE